MSRTGRTSTREPGRNARMFFSSTVKPPLTLPLITPVTISSASKAFSSSFQLSARLAFSRDSLVSPKPSSTASSETKVSSPTATSSSPLSFRNWLRGITASDFRPELTVTQSLSISTTVPATIEPGCMSSSLRDSSNRSAKLSLMYIHLSHKTRCYPQFALTRLPASGVS